MGAALVLALAACKRSTPPKPTIGEAWAAAKLPHLPSAPVIPARRTNVLPVPARTAPPDDPALVALGKKIFFDERLSEPPGTSCAGCHDPARAYSGTHGSRLGVPLGSRPGHYARRTAPSVLYMRYVPAFYYFEDDEAPAPEPRGGFFWDGRVDSLVDLVRQPLFNPDEMNAGTPRLLAGKIARGPYAKEFRAATGPSADPTRNPRTGSEPPAMGSVQRSWTSPDANPEVVMHGVGVALEAFLKSDEMTPARSKYDAYVRGQATLTEQERRGLEAFKDRRRGACAGCHRMAETSSNPAESTFTDYGYDAIGLPRNRELPGSGNPASFDLGICERKGAKLPADDERFCAGFRTPSLRNVAVRASFGHNGVYKTLREVVAFYARRAVAPDRIYPPGQKFDDVPPKYRGNVNIAATIYNRREGAPAPLSDEDIDAIVAFLGTLTDAPVPVTATATGRGGAVAQSPAAE